MSQRLWALTHMLWCSGLAGIITSVATNIHACGWTGFLPLATKDVKYADMVIKYARVLAAPPFNMKRGSSALVGWAKGTAELHPPLDVSACVVKCECSGGTFHVSPEVLDLAGAAVAVGLEPAPSVVRVVGLRPSSPEAVGTARGRVLYGTAAALVSEFGRDWSEAIEMARQCWTHLAPSIAAVLNSMPASDELPSDDDTELHVGGETG